MVDNRDNIEAYYEEHFDRQEKRESRSNRKRAAARDRSKYKATDIRQKNKAKQQNIALADGLVRGRVLSISAAGITVDVTNQQYRCTLRGALKKEKTRMKNLVTVGDFVHLQPLADKEGVIELVEPRKSILARSDNLSRLKQQVIASNIDQVLITVSVVDPVLKPGLVDRYIIAAEKGGMRPVVIVNKIDLLDDPKNKEQKELFELFEDAYRSVGIDVIPVSVEAGMGLDALEQAMKDKASVFSGQSGVGKSSLINAVTGLDLAVGETVASTRKGAHTTTKADLIPLEIGGWCIDTPGIKSFGVWDLDKDEIVGYFPDLVEAGNKCRYPDCRHLGEEGCAIPEAMEAGDLHPIRYDSYLALVVSVEMEHKRR